MTRRLPVALAVVAIAAGSAAPALAAKPKPKPIKGSYTLTLYPDPSPNATTLADDSVQCGVLPTSQDQRAVAIPAAGVFTVDLVATDPIPSASPVHGDWDLYVLDGGAVVGDSHTEFGTEHTVSKFKRKTSATIKVCNISGANKATVSWTFTYK